MFPLKSQTKKKLIISNHFSLIHEITILSLWFFGNILKLQMDRFYKWKQCCTLLAISNIFHVTIFEMTYIHPEILLDVIYGYLLIVLNFLLHSNIRIKADYGYN